ncbi:MAG: Do family serine endopeptidase [Phycisphaerales bacterium]|nr:MAG: Do family serine endopeptidase [Phycisphaerales bacterium]UCG48695.1 MAG: Do family serine endopeptidase [Phycisphaerales bacterium]
MQIDGFKKCKRSMPLGTLSVLCLLLLLGPLTVSAADTESVSALRRMGKAFSSIAEKASPAVVSLTVERVAGREYRQSPFRDPFGNPFEDDIYEFFRWPSPRRRSPQRRVQTAQGTGFIVSSDGYIFTNNHMVGGAEKIDIVLSDGRKFKAEIKGADEPTDIAVIKIDAKNLPHLELADSDDLEVGEWVLAIGNPLGLSHTVTAGIVSAKGRGQLGLASIENFIQTDAAINFGNSGGPLLNLDGKVVGMNTAIVGATGNIGIGFAIPINMIKHAYEQLLAGGEIERGFLGIEFKEVTPGLAASLGLEKSVKGVMVDSVVPDSAAEKAGLKTYDVITELDGEPVEKGNDFLNRVALLNPGTRVHVVVVRDGKRKEFNIKLGKRPSQEELVGGLPRDTAEELGFDVTNLTDDLAQRLGYEGDSGVVVSRVISGSAAARVGIAPGALIMEVNRQKVRNKREFNEAIKQAKKKGVALLRIQQDGDTSTVLIYLSD